jgi:hypothetical protein
MVFRRIAAAIACSGLLLVTTQQSLHAQTTTGGIVGVVKDADGAAVPGATAKAVNTATNAEFTTVSGDTGQYVLRGLPVGPYTLTVELSGFQTFKRTDIVIRVNEDVRIDPALVIGAITETVIISGAAASVDTSSATLKAVVDQQRIESLPLNGRNPTALLQTLSSVQVDPTSLTSGATYPGVVPVSSNGARGNTTNYILDGGSNNDHYSNAPNPMPNPDALQEFSVQTNNFSAEYGRNVGAIVNAVTRSGTNQFHGLGFAYLRDHSLNATNFFTPGVDDGLKRKQYGGTFGGAIKQNRTFFFSSYQGTNEESTPRTTTALVPTAAQRAGDFSALTRQLRNPVTGQPFPNNQIPANMLSPVALKILNEWLPLPNPTGSDSANLLRYAVPVNADDHQFLTRVDHRFSDNHQVYGRAWISRASVPAYLEQGNALTSSFGRTWKNTIFSVNDNYTINSRMLNNLVFTFNRTDNANFQIYPPDYRSLGITNVYNDAATPQWFFNVSGYFGINTGDTNTFNRDEFQIVDTIRMTTAKHEIAMGIDYSYGQGDIVNNFRANGRYTFNGSAPFTGDALADFMLGKFQSFEQGIGEYKNTRMHFFSAFVNDTYRLNPNLTLSLGVRWDPFIPYSDVNDRLAGFRPGQQSTVYVNAPTGAVFPGDANFPKNGYDATLGNLGPRIGFAYDPFGDGKSSIRAGYGIFYDKPNTIATNSPANQGPFGTVVRIDGNNNNGIVDPFVGTTNPFPADPFDVPSNVAFVLPHTMFVYSPDMTNGRLQSWHVTAEREILPTYLVRIAYAGSKGDNLVMGREINAAVYAAGATTATTNQRRPLFPNFGTITQIEPTGRSEYHSMQVTLDKRISDGFSVYAGYTFSKTFDNSSENKQTGATVTNPADIEFDWGPSNSDRRHRFVASWLYELPRFQQRALDAVIGDWALTGIVTLQSGAPFNVTSGADNARTGTGGQRADQIGDPDLGSDRTRDEIVRQYFNTSAFVTNALGTFGNTGRNSLVGPGYANVDIGLHKNFPITSAVRLQFRAEAFNVFNRVNFENPNSDRSSANFGRILTAKLPRILQFALRASF